MLFKQIVRNFSRGSWLYATDKSSLAALRKKTGYTFANCKKALELHNNDLVKAEKWLNEQAQSMGWSKAMKLEGRNTQQGLVGVLVKKNIGAMVEVNCETDFVARNNTFQQFVDTVTRACCHHVSEMPTNDVLSKIDFDGESLKNIILSDGKKLSDHLALIIGKVGENASLRRATCFKATNSITLTSFAHPASEIQSTDQVQFGKFGAIVALHDRSGVQQTDVQRNICQHIVGMNPVKLGSQDVDKPAENKDDETCLIWQEYLLEPSMTVGELLQEHKIEIVDFLRYQCGETVAQSSIQELKVAEAS